MYEEVKKKMWAFMKKHPASLGIFGLGLMAVNLWLSSAMAKEPFFHFVVMVFLINTIAAFGFIRVYHTLTKDRNDEGTKKDS